jgi:hypothetical protein
VNAAPSATTVDRSTARRVSDVVGVAAVVAVIVGLHLLGTGPLAPPPVNSSAAFDRWLADRDSVTVAFSVIRLVALVVAYHLVVTTVLALAARVLHRPGLARLAERWTLPPFRSAVRRVIGLGLSASLALGTPLPRATAAGGRPTATVVAGAGTASMTRLTGATLTLLDGTPPARAADATNSAGRGFATLRLEPPGTATLSLDPGIDAAPVAPAPPDDVLPDHVVVPGDHLWAIADATVSEHLGHPATDAEIDPYWRRVIAANPQFADPDLIYPGAVVHRPPMT